MIKILFRLKHSRGRGHIDFDDYGPILTTKGQHSEWIPCILKVNEHGLVISERVLSSSEMNSDRLWFLKRGIEDEMG